MQEFSMRAAIFAANVAKIEAHNAGESTFTMGTLKFTIEVLLLDLSVKLRTSPVRSLQP
jgi:hypothetical protein